MRTFLLLSISYALVSRLSTTTTPTLPMEQRIEDIKEQRHSEKEEDSRKQLSVQKFPPDSNEFSYDEKGFGKDFVIHPITFSTEHRFRHKEFRPIRAGNGSLYRQIKTTTGKGHTHKSRSELRKELKVLKTSDSGFNMVNPLDLFYRRGLEVFNDNADRKWIHCQDLITPYLNGIKKGPTSPRKISPTDATAKKLFEMINLNVDNFSRDDVMTVVYHISKLQIRLFQWDVMAIRILMNSLTNGKVHTFKSLKSGIKQLFTRWKLLTDNMTLILESTHIIRPPCVETSRYSGSTKSNKVSKFKDWTSKATPKRDIKVLAGLKK